VAKERKFWEILADSQHDNLVLSWLSVVLTVLVIALSALLVRVAIRPMPVVVVPGAAIAGTTMGSSIGSKINQLLRCWLNERLRYRPGSSTMGTV